MTPQDTKIRIHYRNGTFTDAMAIPFFGTIPMVMYTSKETSVLKTLLIWNNSKGERVAECWAEDFQAVEIVP
jgi:hypothetical protein